MKTKLIELLRDNARLTNEQLAARLGLSTSEVKQLLDELESNRVIYGYKALVNLEALGEEIVEAVIEVHVTPTRGEGFDGIARRIYRFPEVRSLYLMSGGSDFLLFMEAKSLKDIAKFVTEKLATMEGVKETQTHFLLKKYKQDGVALDGEEAVERLPVTP
jgi:DNA-binding Lrp family transcriptional regulator